MKTYKKINGNMYVVESKVDWVVLALVAATMLLLLTIGSIAYAGGDDYCEPKVVYKERIVYVDRVKEIPIEINNYVDTTRKNRLSLMIGNAPSTNLRTTILSPISTQVERGDENVLGASYTRDIDKFTLGVWGLSNDSVGVSLGFNF